MLATNDSLLIIDNYSVNRCIQSKLSCTIASGVLNVDEVFIKGNFEFSIVTAGNPVGETVSCESTVSFSTSAIL